MDEVKHRDGTAERRRELYEEAVAVIAREFANDLQIDDVARAVACSRRQLQRVLAETGGTSFRHLMAAVRMREARRLLAEDRVPIKDVAVAVGYHQPAQFSKSFHRHFGEPPHAFRKRMREERRAAPIATGVGASASIAAWQTPPHSGSPSVRI